MIITCSEGEMISSPVKGNALPGEMLMGSKQFVTEDQERACDLLDDTGRVSPSPTQ